MQELEKILEEIDQEKKNIALSPKYTTGYVLAQIRMADRIEDIIRKHMNDGWIPVGEWLPEPGRIVLITQTYSWENFEEGASVTIGRLSPEKNNKMWEFQYYRRK